MTIALRMLAVDEEALRERLDEDRPLRGHRDIEQRKWLTKGDPLNPC
jgi:hypothetical protein